MPLYPVVRPLLFRLDAECAHALVLRGIRHGARLPLAPPVAAECLAMECFGLRFPNPLGLAAGFDKNAEATGGLLHLGLGFVESGTVTPRPQEGNPKPRLFRLPEDEALVNRLGFNNKGLEYVRTRLEQRDTRAGIVGINIGKNKDTEHAIADYIVLLRELGPLADYVTVNISSPNTTGLRDLQRREALTELLESLLNERSKLPRSVPMLLKIAPDLGPAELEDVAQVVMQHRMDGLIVSNTTISRPPALQSSHAAETGGLSGKPLMPLATRTLRQVYVLTEGKIPLVGVGGIASAADAIAKIRAGASLLQLYSALVYQGPALIGDILRGLEAEVRQAGAGHVRELIGTNATE